MYDILRFQPPILSIARDALDSKLDPASFPYLGDEFIKSASARGPQAWLKDRNPEDEGRLILSVVGGISY